MENTPVLNILVVEDNDGLRAATVDFLNAQGHHATGVMCAEEVDDTPTNGMTDLFLIDVSLPAEDGFSLARRLRTSQPKAGIVLMTARAQLHDRIDGYAAGADNYLIKPVEQSEMLACINSLARRLKFTQPQDGELTLDCRSHRLSGPTGEAVLTESESVLLTALARAAERKLERWQAMQLIDPLDKGLVGANLEMRISSLRKKLRACGAADEAIKALRGFGYRLNFPVTIV